MASTKDLEKIRAIIKSMQPRPEPTETRRNEYGHNQVKCPDCGEWCYAKKGSYNSHWSSVHGEPLWKERQIQSLINQAVLEARIEEIARTAAEVDGVSLEVASTGNLKIYIDKFTDYTASRLKELSTLLIKAQQEK